MFTSETPRTRLKVGLLAAFLLLFASLANGQAPPWQMLTAVSQISSSQCAVTGVDAEDFQTLWIAGDFEGTVRIGSIQLTSAGGIDGFVARWNHLTNTFTSAVSFGGVGDEHTSGVDVNGSSAYVAGNFRSPVATFGFRTLSRAGTSGTTDAFVAKIADANSTPFFQWVEAISGPGDEQVSSLSANGAVIIVGGAFSSASATLGTLNLANASSGATTDGFVTSIYDVGSTGTFMWAWLVAGANNEKVTTVLNRRGSIFYGGEFTSTSISTGPTTLMHSSFGAGRDIFVGSLMDNFSSVTPRWAYQVGSSGDDQLTSAERGALGWCITGAFKGSSIGFGLLTLTNANPTGNTSDVFIAQLADTAPVANFLWAHRAGGTGNDVGRAVSFSLQANPSVMHITGDYEGTATFGPHSLINAGPAGTSDIFVARLNDFGNSASYSWAQRAGGASNDHALVVIPTFQNRVFVGGTATPPAQFSAFSLPGTAQTGVGYMAMLLDVEPLTATVTGDTLVCNSGQVVLTATGQGAAVQGYRWSTGSSAATITVTQLGVYSVTVTFNNGTTRTAQRRVSTFTPALQIIGDSLLCTGTALQLQGLAPTASSYQWNTGATTAALAVTQPGTYTLTAHFGSGCAATRRVVVHRATLAITGQTQVCTGIATVLTAVALGARSYRWNTGATSAALTTNIPGTYSVVATFPSGCTLSATQVVTLPTASIRGDSVGCSAQPVRLRASQQGALNYRWSTGATDSTISVLNSGTYSVVVLYPGGCQGSATWRVRIAPELPAFSLGTDTTLCEGGGVVLRPSLSSVNLPTIAYNWSTGATTSTILVQQPGIYTLQLRTSCATRTASKRIEFRPCLTIPNVITPNGDGYNDRFRILGLRGQWSLKVYNRWGQQLYQSNSYSNDWGADTAAGSYYYLLHQLTGSMVYKGWMEVIR